MCCVTSATGQGPNACATLIDERGEPVPYVTVSSFEGETAITDGHGRVCVPCTDSVYTVSFFYDQVIRSCADFTGDVPLQAVALPEVTIAGNGDLRAGRYVINAAFVEDAATIIGESDLLRTLQMLPGIGGGAEGQVAPTVRGGDKDQTLILLDGATLYNPAHAVGFLGAINSDYVRTAEVYKSNFPTRYGGRLSGLIDVTTRAPATDAFHSEVAVGLPNASVTAEGPLGRTRHLLSVRGSYPSLFLIGAESSLIQGDAFYKAELPLGGDQLLSYRFYANRDQWTTIGGAGGEGGENNKSRLAWGNTVQAVRFSRPLLSGVSVVSISSSSYSSGTSAILDDGETVRRLSGLRAVRRSYEAMAEASDVAVTGGTVSVNARVQYGTTETFGIADATEGTGASLSLLTGSLGVEYLTEPAPGWSIRVGARAFAIDEVAGDARLYLEPRVSTALQIGKLRLDAAYDRMTQDVHSVTAGGEDGLYEIFLPPTGAYGAPTAQQFSVGLARPAPRGQLTWSVETYYKVMRGLIFVPNGIALAPDLRSSSPLVERQDGRVYGMELALKYGTNTVGDFVLAYALAKSERSVARRGAWRDDRWDRPHALNLSHTVRLGDRWQASSAFTYQSGYKYSVPAYSAIGGYPSAVPRPVFTERYSARGPAHHRLDLALSRRWEGPRFRHRLTVSLYNAYARRNPFSLYYRYAFIPSAIDSEPGVGTNVPGIERSSILRFVPGIQYRFEL